MSYYFNTILNGKDFDAAIEKVTNELKKEGFGILSEIDVSAAFKNKLNVDFRKYKILGAAIQLKPIKRFRLKIKLGFISPAMW